MASHEEFRKTLKILKNTFSKVHPLFQVISTSLDEVHCRFVFSSSASFDLTAYREISNPDLLPIWFTTSENLVLCKVLAEQNEALQETYGFLTQVRLLLTHLCLAFDLPLPEKVTRLSSEDDVDFDDTSELPLEVSKGSFEDDEEFTPGIECEDETKRRNSDEYVAIETQSLLGLKSLTLKTQAASSKSSFTSGRLLKDLDEIYKSESYRKGVFDVELVGESLFQWIVKLQIVDCDSKLHQDLLKYKALQPSKGYIAFKFQFTHDFPFHPPVVQVVEPVIHCGNVLSNGEISWELLTLQGWSAAYTLECVIIALGAMLVQSEARIKLSDDEVGSLHSVTCLDES